MAIGFQKWMLNVTLIDGGENVTTRRYEMVGADTDYDTVVANAGSVINALNGVTDAVVTGWQLSSVFVEATVTLPAVTVHVEEIASVTLSIDGAPNKSANLSIPAPNIGIFSAASGSGSNKVDTADVALGVYVGLFKSTGVCYISDGEFADRIKGGERGKNKTRGG